MFLSFIGINRLRVNNEINIFFKIIPYFKLLN